MSARVGAEISLYLWNALALDTFLRDIKYDTMDSGVAMTPPKRKEKIVDSTVHPVFGLNCQTNVYLRQPLFLAPDLKNKPRVAGLLPFISGSNYPLTER